MNFKKIKNYKFFFFIFFLFLFFLISLFFLKKNIVCNKKKIDFITYKNYIDYASKKKLQIFFKKQKGTYKFLSLLKYTHKHLKKNDILYIVKYFKNNKVLTKNNFINNILYFRISRMQFFLKKDNLAFENLKKIKDYPWINFSKLYSKNIFKNKLSHKKYFFYWVKNPIFKNFFY
ncbi:UPF0070 protein YfgM [Buchnera aphidicola (Periphyllus testudinaceus)]|uniref:hypothetical protein n=1 Tax=Buchnera aphidicola TaxID=9 RepID=UPI0034646099